MNSKSKTSRFNVVLLIFLSLILSVGCVISGGSAIPDPQEYDWSPIAKVTYPGDWEITESSPTYLQIGSEQEDIMVALFRASELGVSEVSYEAFEAGLLEAGEKNYVIEEIESGGVLAYKYSYQDEEETFITILSGKNVPVFIAIIYDSTLPSNVQRDYQKIIESMLVEIEYR